MPYFDWVTSRVALGGSIDSLFDVRRLAAKGITHILNVRTNQDEVPWVQQVGLQYSSNPTKDKDEQAKPSGWFKSSFDIIFGALSDTNGKILVHCQEGVNRAPSTVYFFLRAIGLDKKTAAQMITDARSETKGGMAWNDDAEAALQSLGFC
jgi:hypothetical protein